MPPLRSPRGQASVELVALLPLLVVLALGLIQVVMAGHAAWAASQAAAAGARAAAVGRDPRAAALTALPRSLERGVRVSPARSGEVAVTVRAPALLRALDLGGITARAQFEPQA